MPRKSKKTDEQPTLTDKEPQQSATDEQGPDNHTRRKGRTPGGQFAAGNPGGPGNPHARHCARMLQVFRDAITEDEILQICRMLFAKAVGGDVSAAKIILSYKIGKALPAHHPDTIDRDEWDHYQQDAMNLNEMKTVLSGLPTRVGNDIARVSLPIMTAARTNELATKLREGLDVESPKDENETSASQADDSDHVEAESEGLCDSREPIPNGKLNENPRHPSEKIRPIANGKTDRKTEGESTNQTAPAAKTNAADKNREGKKMKKRIRPTWRQPLA
jgi:hypothetical protein